MTQEKQREKLCMLAFKYSVLIVKKGLQNICFFCALLSVQIAAALTF